MEIIEDSDTLRAVRLTEDELESVVFGIGLALRRITKVAYIDGEDQDFRKLESIEHITEVQAQLAGGDGLLCTDPEIFIARWGLQELFGYHNWSLSPISRYEYAAQDVGLKPAEMFGHATNAMKLLEVIPTPEPECAGVLNTS